MKKAQVLSAFALAFALGVATPLASVANAFEVTNDQNGTATGTATCEELNKAIESVQKNAYYQWYVDLKDTNDKYDAGDYRDITRGGAFSDYFGVNKKTIGGSFATANPNAAQKFNNDLQAVYDAMQIKDEDGNVVPANTIAYVRNALAQAENLPYATYFVALNQAISTGENLDTAVKNFRAHVPGAEVLPEDPNNFSTINVAMVDGIYGAGVMTWYANIADEVENRLTPDYEKAVAGKAAYETLLNQSGVLSDSGATYVEINDKDTNPTVVMNLRYATANNHGEIAISHYWYDNYDKITGMTPCDENTVESTNFTDLWAIATNYKYATGQTSINTTDIAESLIGGTVTPVQPSEVTAVYSLDGAVTVVGLEGTTFADGTVVKYEITKATLVGDSYENVKAQTILDIWLEDIDGNEIPVADRKVSVTVDSRVLGWVNPLNAEVYYVVPGADIDDEYTEIADFDVMDVTGRTEAGITFTTTHFSYYAFVEYEDDNSGSNNNASDKKDDNKGESLDNELSTIKSPNTGVVASSAAANTAATTAKATTSVVAVVAAAAVAIAAAFGIARKTNRK